MVTHKKNTIFTPPLTEQFFACHGEWSDPEILYDNHLINCEEVENYLFSEYQSECEEDGNEVTENGFEKWLQKVGTQYIETILDEFIYDI
ncbi:MAG: hypothetical protein ACI30H_01670 [Paludibacteraceae bacterium]